MEHCFQCARDWWPLQGGIQAEGGLGYVLQGITSAKAKPNLLLYPRLKCFELAILPAFHIWGERWKAVFNSLGGPMQNN